ncbi:transglutaminase-like putative cysteine protease [Microbacterium sp. AK009]|uniref:transglutaminase-like domain-containing protein n=1 Tax=Microbacterium sp. AK009 TaxID=2723068 RepID=UPI0015C81B27|nr:transglutaminase family protein [Microbacterium sp. AK009]NYF15763.1 transglutaminase-like putative cysteine protease [Microbacterium sp. AK009]
MQRDVGANLELEVTEASELVFSVAIAAGVPREREHLSVTLDEEPVETEELEDEHGTRLHRVVARPGTLVLDYSATVVGRAEPAPASAAELVRYRRPSRYAESDALVPTAAAEFAGITDPAELLASVSSWVGTHLAYVSGSSLPTDGAMRTLLARQGVCRDFAHLTVALLRARNVPARLVSVYAPGLDPMDFHAVAEAHIDDAWYVVDATTLAPRRTLVRIATGRDAADTAFLTTISGAVTLGRMTVTAIADALPDDDVTELVPLG